MQAANLTADGRVYCIQRDISGCDWFRIAMPTRGDSGSGTGGPNDDADWV